MAVLRRARRADENPTASGRPTGIGRSGFGAERWATRSGAHASRPARTSKAHFMTTSVVMRRGSPGRDESTTQRKRFDSRYGSRERDTGDQKKEEPIARLTTGHQPPAAAFGGGSAGCHVRRRI